MASNEPRQGDDMTDTQLSDGNSAGKGEQVTESVSEYTDHRPSLFPWPPVLLLSAIGIAFALGRLQPISWPGLDDTAARIVGLGIGGLGVFLMLWAALALRQAKTTIMPHKGADALVTSGPFVRFRNPIYLGDLMLLLGLAELTKNIWFVATAVAFAVLVTLLAILPEERHLEARFGDAYRDYKERSRRWI